MNTKTVVIGVVILLALIVVISLSGISGPPSERPVGDSSGDDKYSRCVDDALRDAENCLLSGGSDCKAKGERALDDCKKLQ